MPDYTYEITGNLVRLIDKRVVYQSTLADFIDELLKDKEFISEVIPTSCISLAHCGNLSIFVLEQLPSKRNFIYAPFKLNQEVIKAVDFINKTFGGDKNIIEKEKVLPLHLPYLYFFITFNQEKLSSVRVLYSESRVKLTTEEKLFRPFFLPNIMSNYTICWGVNRFDMGEKKIEEMLDEIVVVFYSSPFNNDAYEPHFFNKYISQLAESKYNSMLKSLGEKIKLQQDKITLLDLIETYLYKIIANTDWKIFLMDSISEFSISNSIEWLSKIYYKPITEIMNPISIKGVIEHCKKNP